MESKKIKRHLIRLTSLATSSIEKKTLILDMNILKVKVYRTGAQEIILARQWKKKSKIVFLLIS